MNCWFNFDLESVFLIFVEKNLFILLILVKEVVRYNGDVSEFVDFIVVKVL